MTWKLGFFMARGVKDDLEVTFEVVAQAKPEGDVMSGLAAQLGHRSGSYFWGPTVGTDQSGSRFRGRP